MTDHVAGDVEVHKVILKSVDGCREFDVRQQVRMINIFESVLSPTIIAEIRIKDNISLYTGFPLLKEEYVHFEFQTPGYDNTTKYDLYVVDIVDMSIDENMKGMSYTLVCCSKELIMSNLQVVNQKFKKEASSIVQEIYETYLRSDKPLDMVATRGIEEETITQLAPLKAIDKFRLYASASDNTSSAFVFFENRDGFTFNSLENIFAKGKKSVCDRVFYFDSLNNLNMNDINIRNILAYQLVQGGNAAQRAYDGYFTSIGERVDILSKKITKTPYVLPEAQQKFQPNLGGPAEIHSASYLNNFLDVAGVQNPKKKRPVKRLIVPFTSERDDTQRTQKLLNMRSFVQQFTSNMINIHIYGDTAITAGDVIQCNFPEATGLTVDPKLNRIMPGNYMVTRLRHMITFGDRYVHTMAAELGSGAYLER